MSGRTSSPVSTAGLLRKHRSQWHLAVQNPFLEALRRGGIPRGHFLRWTRLAAHLLNGISGAIGRILTFPPAEDRLLLVEALAILLAQQSRFEAMSRSRGGDPSRPAAAGLAPHLAFLRDLHRHPYPVAIAAIWAEQTTFWKTRQRMERAGSEYHRAIHGLVRIHAASFPRRLRRHVDAVLRRATPAERRAAEIAVLHVLELKLDFWVVALEEDEPRRGR